MRRMFLLAMPALIVGCASLTQLPQAGPKQPEIKPAQDLVGTWELQHAAVQPTLLIITPTEMRWQIGPPPLVNHIAARYSIEEGHPGRGSTTSDVCLVGNDDGSLELGLQESAVSCKFELVKQNRLVIRDVRISGGTDASLIEGTYSTSTRR
jgi:hypothetical protein